jgi:hypothetical protein
MKRMIAVLAVLAMTCVGAFCGDAYDEALALLRQAQSDHSVLVPAVKALARVAEEMEKANDPRIAEVNSCLYWAKKLLTLADTQVLGGNGTVKRLEVVAKAVPASGAKAMLDKAEAFAKGHADDPLLVAIRYFEVADRFPETAEGRKAMANSLTAMQRVGKDAPKDTAPKNNQAKGTYLSDFSESKAVVFNNALGKNGKCTVLGTTFDIVVNGKVSEKGLLVNPPAGNGQTKAKVSYKIGGKYREMEGAVAMNDTAVGKCGEQVFEVVGDGKLLWKSKPTKTNHPEKFLIQISGIQELTLTVTGTFSWAHAVWIDPLLK